MIVDSHPPVPNSAVFDPATMRNKPQANVGTSSNAAQQQARQRYWSGMALSRPNSMQDATNQQNGQGGQKVNPKLAPHQQWTAPAEKEIYTPFKSASGRATPLDDPYSPNLRPIPALNEYMPAPQDPRDRPPSRAMSMQSGMLGGLGTYRRDRKSEGSVVYQPLTPTNHASAWSNSLMFNKPYGPLIDPFDQSELPLGASALGPPLPHIQTLPRQLPLARNQGKASPPDEPTHNNRQQIPQQPFASMNGYIPMGGPSQDFQKPEQKSNGNRVTITGGTALGSPSSISSGELAAGDAPNQDEDDKSKKSKSKRRLSRQRDRSNDRQSIDTFTTIVAIVEKLAILHILLGLCLFALGIARLLLMSVWGLGIELVYGVYVVLMGTLGVIGYRRRHYCSLVACCIMSALSCVLAIPPFVTGLLVTVPDSFRTVDPKLFTSPQEPYAVDILLSVICLLELLVSIITSALACSIIGKAVAKWRQSPEDPNIQQSMGQHQSGSTKIGPNQQPIFHTSVNITHPSMMK